MLHFSITLMVINPLTSFPSSLSHWFKLLHYPKLAGNSGMGEKDVREGNRRFFFCSSSIKSCLDPEVLLSAHLCFPPIPKRKPVRKKQPRTSIRTKAAARGGQQTCPLMLDQLCEIITC